MQLAKDLQAVKDRRHAAIDYKYHLIDLLRMSKFTFAESMARRLKTTVTRLTGGTSCCATVCTWPSW